MSTHRRAWMVRAGVIATVALAGLFGLAAPAVAAGPDPQITDVTVNPGTIAAGASTTVNFTVRNNGDAGTITVEVSSSNQKVTCANICKFVAVTFPKKDDSGAAKPYSIKFNASGAFTNDEQANFTVKAGDKTEQQQVTIQAPKQQQPPPASATVPEVTGTVTDVYTGSGIEGAKVGIQDSGATTWEVGTDKSGNFKITTSPDKPIKPGIIAFTVSKTGLQDFGTTKTAVANQPLRAVTLQVTPITSSAASAPADTGTEAAGPPVQSLASDAGNVGGSGSSGLSGILIAVGAVLVALGVGAIVLLFVRKKNEDDPDGEEPANPRKGGPPPPGRGGPRPPQSRAGMPPPPRGAPGYDPTRQMRPPVSPGPRGDQTMISPSPLANAPTQLHSRVPPEHDPYGAPPPRHNGAPPGYGQPPGQGQGPGPYGAASGGYGQPTNANPTAPYPGGAPTSAYPGGAPTYGQGPDQYGQPGYGQAYGQGPAPDPYGQPPAYGQGPATDPYGPAGYDQQGYDQPGYGPAHGNGYDPRGQEPRGPEPRAPRPAPPQQDPRRVDWLDD